jgi:nitric oxide reductase subunit B
MVFGFSVLIGGDRRGLPQGAADSRTGRRRAGAVLFTSEDVAAGQQVFLKHGLMNNGTIWGHGAYLGPDFSAQYLHNWALDVADQAAQERFRRPYVELTAEQQAEIDGGVARTMKQNRYDACDRDLELQSGRRRLVQAPDPYWRDYFVTPANNGGLKVRAVSIRRNCVS